MTKQSQVYQINLSNEYKHLTKYRFGISNDHNEIKINVLLFPNKQTWLYRTQTRNNWNNMMNTIKWTAEQAVNCITALGSYTHNETMHKWNVYL